MGIPNEMLLDASIETLTEQQFIRMMEEVWEGGKWYDNWHDARRVLAALGAKKLYGVRAPERDNYAYIYQLPSGDRVKVGTDGGWCAPGPKRQLVPKYESLRP